MLNQYPPDCCDPVGGERPAVYDVDQIVSLCAAAAQAEATPNPVPTAEAVEECLHQLLGDPSFFLERKSHPRGYLINLRALFAALRLAHVQSLCRARYGPLASRIFRCLLVHKRLEETQLSEYATAPRKDVRRLLYTMLDAHLVSVQEVPRTADRLPQKTFYLWGVDVARVQSHYLDSLYFSWCNLRTRGELETDHAKPVLDKVDTSKVITPQERDRVEKWKKGADRIELGLHQINQLIMLFHDF
jgi:DNA-directed RNA polymerase III subunit RPC3